MMTDPLSGLPPRIKNLSILESFKKRVYFDT